MKYFFCIVTLLLLPIQAVAESKGPTPEEHSDMHRVVVYRSIDLMQEHVMTRDDVDWDAFRGWATAALGANPSLQDRNQVLYRLLKITKTNHSFYRDAKHKRVVMHSDFTCRVDISDEHTLADNIGYVRVDSFGGGDKETNRAHANGIQAQIAEQDKKSLIGWVVDLRRNSGGNMWPMLAGVSALLGDGDHGQFIAPGGNVTHWGIQGNNAKLGSGFIGGVDQQLTLNNKGVPIVVLSSKKTASAGEAILVAFKKQPNVTFIGQTSCGRATANRAFKLMNGDRLMITVATMADRDGVEYPNGVDVDLASTNALLDAEEWLKSQH